MLHGNIVKEKITVLDYISSLLIYGQVENQTELLWLRIYLLLLLLEQE